MGHIRKSFASFDHLVGAGAVAGRLMQLSLPVYNSPYQESDFVQATTLAKLAHLDIDLGIEFTLVARRICKRAGASIRGFTLLLPAAARSRVSSPRRHAAP
jgi:hypothetical protein